MDFKEYHGKVFLNSRDSFCSDFFEVNMFDTVNNKGILPFKLNTTFCASFVFWGQFFQYFVDFETKFAESFFLKSIIYYPGWK
jgi:hypothetical protein